MRRYDFWDYFLGSFILFASIAAIVGGAIDLALHVHWIVGALWAVIGSSLLAAFLAVVTDK